MIECEYLSPSFQEVFETAPLHKSIDDVQIDRYQSLNNNRAYHESCQYLNRLH